jgi:DnaK suppressor protein
MDFPTYIDIQNFKIPTLAIFLGFGALNWFYSFWYEGRRDGFGSARLFDLAFSSLGFGILTYFLLDKLLNNLAIYQPMSFILNFNWWLLLFFVPLLVSYVPILALCRRWKWSVYRVLDIHALAFSELLFFGALGAYIIFGISSLMPFLILIPAVYMLVLRFRGYKFRSGLVFSLFLFFLALYTVIFYPREGYLLFCFLLSTIGLATLYFREKKTMLKRRLSKDFIDRMYGFLIGKEKKLKEEQELLRKEDPYMVPGRDVGNADSIDEAILEDATKARIDRDLSLMKIFEIQVKKALSSIKLGNYGVCEGCGNAIDMARLKAYPEATSCIKCSKKSKNK